MDRRIIIAGGGPSGLFAAQQIASHQKDCEIIVLEARRYVGRKFLVAGKSGLNLTNGEPISDFLNRYSGPRQRWEKLLSDFDNDDLRAWATDLGFETFQSSGNKIFPRPMKAAPLLRAWMDHLKQLDIQFRFNSPIASLSSGKLTLDNGETLSADAIVLAFGGASWPDTGSDGTWQSLLTPHDIEITPFAPANCGWAVDWPEPIKEIAGSPLKNTSISLEGVEKLGEITITEYGLEGGPIYHLGPALRQRSNPPTIYLDFKPNLSLSEIESRLAAVKKNYIREAKRRCKLDDSAATLLKHLPHLGPWKSGPQIAAAIKQCPIELKSPQPIAKAISSAGGVKWEELDENLMLNKLPNVYCTGEMIDWEAPTGGYLLQGCFSMAFAVGHAIAKNDLLKKEIR